MSDMDVDENTIDNEGRMRYRIMDVFKPYIMKKVVSTQIVLHLPSLTDKLPELRSLEKNGCHEQSIEKLLRYIDNMDEKGKWQSFCNALKNAGYTAVYECLDDLHIPTDKDDEDYAVIGIFLNEICQRVSLENSNILPFLFSKKVISDDQNQRIRACYQQHSLNDAMLELFFHLHRKSKKWYTIFLESLLYDGQNELVELIDPKFYSKKMEYDKIKTTFNFENMDYETHEDRMEGSGDAYDAGDLCGNMEETSATDLNNFSASSSSDKLESLQSNLSNNMESLTTAKSFEKYTEKKELNYNITGEETGIVSMVESRSTDEDLVNDKPVKSLELRNYQIELSKVALLGKNTIICAPTGSGKTIVAVKIIKEHLVKGGIRKVAFLVNQVALAAQQYELFKEYLNCRIEILTGETQMTDKMPLSKLLAVNDIVIMTAQILVDSISEREVKDITSFSLIIFDECHHTKARHPYNQLMDRYMDVKHGKQMGSEIDPLELQYQQKPSLPQVVGLTASVGVGKASRVSGAVDHIISLCANLDTEKICTSVEYQEDMTSYVNVPISNIQRCKRRENDVFYQTVVEIIHKIERDMQESPFLESDEEEVKIFKKEHLKPPSKKGHESYIQWVSTLKRGIASLDDPKARRFFVTSQKLLEIFNSALIINSDCRAKDSLEYMEEEMGKSITPNQSRDARAKLISYFTDKRGQLLKLSKDPNNKNPKLVKLQEMIIDGFSKNPDSRAIVFAKTLALVQKLKLWIEETPCLNKLRLNPETVTGSRLAADKGGMTRNRQIEVLECFKDGNSKLIIATSVAEEGLDIQKCNLVIRYDHVTNEIAMVQSRGRARAEDSKFYVLAGEESNSARKEEMNLSRELMMKQAIIELDSIDPLEFQTRVQEEQKKAKLYRDLERKRSNGRILNDSEFSLRCFQCNTLACFSTDIRTLKSSQYTVIDDAFINCYIAKPHPSPGEFKAGFNKKDKIYCKKCNYDWGIGVLYHNVDYPLIKIESFVIEDNGGKKTTVKKWKNVPFRITEISDDDLRMKFKQTSGNLSENDSGEDDN